MRSDRPVKDLDLTSFSPSLLVVVIMENKNGGGSKPHTPSPTPPPTYAPIDIEDAPSPLLRLDGEGVASVRRLMMRGSYMRD